MNAQLEVLGTDHASTTRTPSHSPTAAELYSQPAVQSEIQVVKVEPLQPSLNPAAAEEVFRQVGAGKEAFR